MILTRPTQTFDPAMQTFVEELIDTCLTTKESLQLLYEMIDALGDDISGASEWLKDELEIIGNAIQI